LAAHHGSVVGLDDSGQTTLNAAWTLMHLSAAAVLNLKRAGAAVTEESFIKMARDVYREALVNEAADGGMPPVRPKGDGN
jgi:hypothetical protein